MAEIAKLLETASIPISTENCRTCADPCDEGHDEYPKLDVDLETQMLGSVKPFRRQVVISTGKSDWEREVTSVQGSLAAHLLAASEAAAALSLEEKSGKTNGTSYVPGVFTHRSANRISILNSSLQTISEDTDKDTVLVFPDYKVVFDVDRSSDGAAALWSTAVDPVIDVVPTATSSLPIPYSCVIMLCSHKRRDNRCHVASGFLEHGLLTTLHSHGWQVDTQIDHSNLHDSLDSPTPTALASLKRALIIRTSHVGGHKYAGNVIINTPQGYSIWYGRVTPHEVDSIVKTTIVDGKIIPSLLRGGMNISKPNCKTLHDW